ncbi:MAG: hypothetical protein RMM31_08815 [Anaerolineae bacterium]|nr:hypothetical protein [Anaerolineae bacterium]
MHLKSLFSFGITVSLLASTVAFAQGSAAAQAPSASPTSCQSWESLGPIVDGALDNQVNALAVRGTDVFVGGKFLGAGDNPDANYIARWDGKAWQALGKGLNGEVTAIAVTDSDLYVGGRFTDAGGNPDADGVARWDGQQWQALGKGVKGFVSTIAVSGTQVYVGGNFEVLGSTPQRTFAAAWDGRAWRLFGQDLDGNVNAIAVSTEGVYLGGYFKKAGGLTVNHIARWDGAKWHALGDGLDAHVSALLVDGRNLYVGGRFTKSGEQVLNYIALWDGAQWKPMGAGLSGEVEQLARDQNSVYAAGRFAGRDPRTGGLTFDQPAIVVWNGRQWRPLTKEPTAVLLSANKMNVCCSAVLGMVRALVAAQGSLFAGGVFTNLGGNAKTDYLARWDGRRWQNLGESKKGPIDGQVFAVAADDKNIYIAGQFTNGGGLAQGNHIIRWDGSKWQPLGRGTNDSVHTAVMSGKTLLVGGRFKTASGTRTGGTAVWNGTRWQSLVGDLDVVSVVTVDSLGNLYASGLTGTRARVSQAPTAASAATPTAAEDRIRYLSGGAAIRAILPAQGQLFVAGETEKIYVVEDLALESSEFLGVTINGVLSVRNIRTSQGFERIFFDDWQEIVWKGYIITDIYDLESDGKERIFAAVSYVEGGETKYRVLQHTLGSGELQPISPELNGTPIDLAFLPNGRLVVAGYFTQIGNDSTLRYIAQWDGKQWQPLGNGLNSAVLAVGIAGNRLVIGGDFTNAGSDPTADRVATCILQ